MSDHAKDLRQFWQRFQRGVEVAVDGLSSDRLLGVRDGFLRYFHDGMERPVPVAVVPQELEGDLQGLAPSDAEALRRARDRASRLRLRLGSQYHFFVSTEASVQVTESDEASVYFVRVWTCIVSPVGTASGASGSFELPRRLLGRTGSADLEGPVPGTRRGGGIFSSVTGGLETRRSAVKTGTLLALSSLFFGVLETSPARRRLE